MQWPETGVCWACLKDSKKGHVAEVGQVGTVVGDEVREVMDLEGHCKNCGFYCKPSGKSLDTLWQKNAMK